MASKRINLAFPLQARPQATSDQDPSAGKTLGDAAFTTHGLPRSLTRSVYCVLGIPIDAIDLATVTNRIEASAAQRTPLFISTPNLNFLVSSLSDFEFRESLLDSDLCCPDGAPIVWIARLLGLPIKERVAGSDFFDRLQTPGARARPLSVFLFGGAKGVAAAAAKKLNATPEGLNCVGTMYPGFCEVSEMSEDHIIDTVNSSDADFLSVSLGAKKGQLWLYRNRDRLTIPIRVHLGAAINFQAGIIERAPAALRTWGLEWLWRIKEEHYLWKRYLNDGLVLLRLLMTRVLPLAASGVWFRVAQSQRRGSLLIAKRHDAEKILIGLNGIASEIHVPNAIAYFQEALTSNQDISIDLSNTRYIDARFLGLLLMLRKELNSRRAKLTFTGASPTIEKIFRLNEVKFLLSSN